MSCLPGKLGRCGENGATSLNVVKSSEDSSNDPITLLTTEPSSPVVVSEDITDANGLSFEGSLPSFNTVCDPNFMLGDIPGDSFVYSVTCSYDEVIHWKKFCLNYLLLNVGELLFQSKLVFFVLMAPVLHLNVLL